MNAEAKDGAGLRHFVAGLLLLLLVATTGWAQDPESQPVGKQILTKSPLDTSSVLWRYRDHPRSLTKFLTLDHAAFRYDNERIQLELCAAIVRDFLGLESVANGIQAHYEMTFQVRTPSDSVLIESSWERTNGSPDSLSRRPGQRIPELIRYVLYPGRYRIFARVDDLVNNVYFDEEYAIELKPVETQRLTMSDILFASRIEKAQGDVGEFDHNGLLVLPNAERMYGDSNPRLFYYAEIYNLAMGPGDKYKTYGRVLTAEGDEVRPLRTRERPIVGAFLVEVDAFSVATLHSGSYQLELTSVDETAGDTCVVHRSFWVYKEQEAPLVHAPIGYPGFDVAALNDEELDKELAVIRPILTDRARAQIQQLTTREAKQRFLAQFWSVNDPDTSTVVNEFRDEYMQRLKVVEDRYSSFRREGWETDRGRVYLRYGEPTTIEDFPYSSEVHRAYQIWTYDKIEGGVQFVFVDRTNLGDYIQVHSTKRGELSYPDWRNTELK